METFFFIKSELSFIQIRKKIGKLFQIIIFYNYYKPVVAAELNKWWHNKLLVFFLLNGFMNAYLIFGEYVLILMLLFLTSFLTKKNWSLYLIFFVTYVVILLSFLECFSSQKAKFIVITVSVFFLKDLFEAIFKSFFWMLSYAFCCFPIIFRLWDLLLVRLFFFFLEIFIVFGPLLLYLYLDYTKYLAINETLIGGSPINFFRFILLTFTRIKMQNLALKILE